MPELPEVETVRLGIQSWVGQELTLNSVNDKRVWFESTVNAKDFSRVFIEDVSRRGKYLVLRFRGKTRWMIHLRMTGKILKRDSSNIPRKLFSQAKAPSPQIRTLWTIGNESWVFYDTRRFGTITAVDDEDSFWARKKISPDPILQSVQARRHFLEKVKLSKKNIKAALLDQSIIAGVGNIYADEALFAAGISPLRQARKVKNLEELWDKILDKFQQSIKEGGSSILNYVNSEGKKGNFVASLKVYGRADEPCTRCKQELVSLVCAGRTTVYCKHCQR